MTSWKRRSSQAQVEQPAAQVARVKVKSSVAVREGAVLEPAEKPGERMMMVGFPAQFLHQ